MPWHARSLPEEREAFIQRVESGAEYFSAVCQWFGISRVAGYKWLKRYREAGKSRDALKDQSRRPHRICTVGNDIQREVLRLRAQHHWGPHKIAAFLKAESDSIGHSTVHRILKEHGQIPSKDPNAVAWIHDVFAADSPKPNLGADFPEGHLSAEFLECFKQGCVRDRKKAIAVVARSKGMSLGIVAKCLKLTTRTIARYCAQYASGGIEALFCKRRCKINDTAHKDCVLALLHSPPSASGINRTTWKLPDLQRVLRERGHLLSEQRIRRIIKDAGYRWRRAKTVLTSNDPQYETKLRFVKDILANLAPDEAFFSIDEYGPFAIKKKPGRKLIAPGTEYTVPQWQKSKGWMIMTAALELSRNQVTHFYSRQKNTEEMIKMADFLRLQYQHCSKIYLSWDAASWHISRQLLAHIRQVNAQAAVGSYPSIDLAPLPAGAQFLNVIESIFSGMSRAIIHNSDYASLEAAKAAIDRYFAERNAYFAANPKHAGNKI